MVLAVASFGARVSRILMRSSTTKRDRTSLKVQKVVERRNALIAREVRRFGFSHALTIVRNLTSA